MIFVSKKKMIGILRLITLVLLMCCGIYINKENKTVPTMSFPVSNKVIVIDAGHGVPDEGVSLLH